MRIKHLSTAIIIFLSILSLSACNLPERQTLQAPTQPYPSIQTTPASISACTNQYFPNQVGDKWEYSGVNSLTGAYTRTDTISNLSANSFTQETIVATTPYSVRYDCAPTGLVSLDPVQQYAGALLNSLNLPVNVKVISNTGTSLPSKINPGDTWQQTADWEASSQQVNISGRFVFDYTAIGYESISVQAGTYNALRIDATIRIEVTSLHVLAGTYTTTIWLVPEVGLVKSEGTSHIPEVDFTDRMELTGYTPVP